MVFWLELYSRWDPWIVQRLKSEENGASIFEHLTHYGDDGNPAGIKGSVEDMADSEDD
jgi:hypothetical protein